MTLKFKTFSLFLLTECVSGLFCIANLLEMDGKKHFLNKLWIVTPIEPN